MAKRKQAKKPKSKRATGPAGQAPSPQRPYEVRLTASAEAAYERFADLADKARERGDETSQHITTLKMIDEVLDKFIPHDPFNKRYALQGELSRVFRYWKGRLRICWMGSSETRKIYVIFISETLRKAGDANDPYRILTRLVMSGQFDSIFDELGLERPTKNSVNPFQVQ